MPPDSGDALTPEQFKARESAIRDLLTLCAERQVDIPDSLRAALLGEEITKEEERAERAPLIGSLISDRAAQLATFEDTDLMKEIRKNWEALQAKPNLIELRVVDGSYTVTTLVDDLANDDPEDGGPKRAKQKIDTVYNSSFLANLLNKVKGLAKTGRVEMKRKKEDKVIMDNINLRFQAGKMYLVLGAPGSGKSTLLKMIADSLRKDPDHVVGGTVQINRLSPTDKSVHWTNLVSYIDQIDRLHSYLTVFETLEFAWRCRSGGTHAKPNVQLDNPQVKALIEKMDNELYLVNKVMEGLGLTRVKDTFVGDNTRVRGVSGGEKKRVTVAEMLCVGTPVVCCDEISTGLDAATTYDIAKLMGSVGSMTGSIRIVSLLQPPPETVALFDELILLDSGRVIYSGPVDQVVSHFESLGYKIPHRMDVADWLQALPTRDGQQYLTKRDEEEVTHLSTEEFMHKFDTSPRGQEIQESLKVPFTTEHEEKVCEFIQQQYKNSSIGSLKLLLRREFTLWWRDKYQIRARVMQDLIMGIVAGTVFWQASGNPQSVLGILFQSMFFVCIGAMLKIPEQFEPRSIFYKHQDANFFPTWAYVVGRSLAGFPTSLIDGFLYGSIIYWFVGLAYNDGATIANFFIFILLVLAASLTAGLVFSIFSAVVKDKPTAQACMSVSIVVLVLFSGFTVQPNVIPSYWIWVYWVNLFAWVLRSLTVNQFQSGQYDEIQDNGLTEGDSILIRFGFTLNGEAFQYVWVWYGLIFAVGAALVSVTCSNFFLATWRFETGKGLGTIGVDDNPVVDNEEETVEIPFQKVNLTFKGIGYTVKASTRDEYLELLKGVDGFVEAGKMTALMGSSGAGKTTLMDVLALRKSSGEITGEVRLNGHLQEPRSFRRCTGYVEQFDEQQPQITIRETVEFSARLRLEETDPAVTPESTKKFIDQTLEMLELTHIQDLQVGSDLTGGLSFEQKKRLSIAVELVSNPSIIFLDEPTSGLDARAAGIVMRGLKRIAQTGRAICATIHQPSIAIFSSFDSLLLLKRGGETVFFGDLGEESSSLIAYLERYPVTPKIRPGENPATWMLTTIGAGSSVSGAKPFDYAGSYAASQLRDENLTKIEEFCASASDDNRIAFPNKYATGKSTQRRAVLSRVLKIYWRSPSYNLVRLMVSAIVAFLFGSVYASQRVPENEGDMNSRVTSIFITFLFLSVNAFNTVLSVYETERNMFYRHKAALMYNEKAILAAFTLAEFPFILLASMVFCLCFYFLVGFSPLAYKFFLYYLFFTLNLGLWTFLGQMMMSLVRDAQTAQGFGGLLIGLTSLFTGILIRPDEITGFWTFAYWLLPGHYVLEGLLMSQFNNDDTPIEASVGSPFWDYLGCTSTPCFGTAYEWVLVSFGFKFEFDHLPWDFLYLFGVIVVSKVITYFALTRLNYLAK